MAPAKLKIAVIGAGDMGHRHIEAWQSLGHDVCSLTDCDQQLASEVAASFAIPVVHPRYQDALSDPDVDAVSICLPLRYHAPVAIAAAQAGKHIMCEKPMARSLREADMMEAAVRAAGVTFATGFQRNYATGVSLLRTWALEGRFGHPMIYNYDLLAEVRPKVAMHDRDGNNGPWVDGGCHHYLKFQTVFRSRPTTVYARGRTFAIDRPELAMHRHLAVDSGVLTIEYESGDLATMTASWGLAPGTRLPGPPDRVLGPKGCAVGDVHQQLTLYQGAKQRTTEFEPENLHAAEFTNFADAIENGREPIYGIADGRQMLALTRAIEKSVATGQPAYVDYGL